MQKEIYADCEYATAYVNDGITYLPHYTQFGLYVGPGYSGKPTQKTYCASELELLGSQPIPLLLWSRPKPPKAK